MKSTYEKPLMGRRLLHEILKAVEENAATEAAQIEPITLHIWRTPIEDEYIIEICKDDDKSVYISI